VSALLTKKRLMVSGAVLVALVCGVLVRGLAGMDSPTKFFDGADVYVAGSRGSLSEERACVWKNGVEQELGNDMGLPSKATSVFVSGGDVYVAGSEPKQHFHVSWFGGSYRKDRAVVWKNSVIQRLSDQGSTASSVFVSGDDVYVAGDSDYEYPIIAAYATLWKNGVAQRLSDTISTASSVFVSGNDVYVVGYGRGRDAHYATVWKNGVRQRLSDENSEATSVFVSGNDVYVAGYEKKGNIAHATVWKNGVAQRLSEINTTRNSYASSVFVSGNEVYVAGGGDRPPTLWKNGIIQDLSQTGNMTSVFTGDEASRGYNITAEQLARMQGKIYSIFVSGNDVYMMGYVQKNAFDAYQTVVWKNGTLWRWGIIKHDTYGDYFVSPGGSESIFVVKK
jgi:hypothetical protein